MVRQNIERFRTKLADLRIPPDIRYVRMTDIERALTIYGHRPNLLNNNSEYFVMYRARSRSGRVCLSCALRGRIARQLSENNGGSMCSIYREGS